MIEKPVFGRRESSDTAALFGLAPTTPAAATVAPPPPPPQGPAVRAPATRAPADAKGVYADLRALCLARLDPTIVAGMTAERLANEVERLISDIATEQRIQLNAREQRQLSQDLVDDMLGLGPLEPLLEDDGISDIMVNGPDRIFVEKGGKVL
jgi:pilus assembly protein CpaF